MRNLMRVRKSNLFKKSKILERLAFQGFVLRSLYEISPTLLMKYRYLIHVGRLPKLNNPKTFDEKLIWLNLYWQHPLKTLCSDKYAVRGYVKKHYLQHILVPLLGVYNNPLEIDFEQLPDKFVLKCTHGSHLNIICQNKKALDINLTRKKLAKWMKINFAKINGELHYSGIKPKIISEVFLSDLLAELPIDYKIFCFNGKAHCIMACLGRNITGHAKYFLYYDVDWKKIPYNQQSIQENIDVPKPSALQEMIESAEILSKPFPHVRIDYYNIKNRAVLGEMTFTSDACIHSDLTEFAQQVMGDLIILPEKICL